MTSAAGVSVVGWQFLTAVNTTHLRAVLWDLTPIAQQVNRRKGTLVVLARADWFDAGLEPVQIASASLFYSGVGLILPRIGTTQLPTYYAVWREAGIPWRLDTR